MKKTPILLLLISFFQLSGFKNTNAQGVPNIIVKKIGMIHLYSDTPKSVIDFDLIGNCQDIIIFNKSPKKIDYIFDAFEVIACGKLGYMDIKDAMVSWDDMLIVNKWKQEDRQIRLEFAKSVSEKLDSLQKRKKELELERIELISNYEDSATRVGLSKKIQFSKNAGIILFWTWHEDGKSLVSQNLSFEILNQGNKTIKYINFMVSFFNPVNDVVAIKTLKGIGPIQPKAKAEYKFDNAYFSKIVDHVKIKSINIIYSDGSSKILPMSMIDKIDLSFDEWKYLKNH